jgi:hypothetical protein
MLVVSILPPFGLKLTVYWFAVQCAYSLWFDAVVTFVEDVIFVPPVAAVYHPLNVYPAFVGVGSMPYALPYVTSMLVTSILPPFGLKLTVYVRGVQCAYSL